MTASERAAVLVYDGVAELDAVGPYDVFATAGRQDVPVEASLVSAEPVDGVEAIGGLELEPDGVLDPADPPACLVVPGGRWSARAADGAWAEAQRGTLPNAIRGCEDNGTLVAGVGAGVCLLAEAGLGEYPATLASDGGRQHGGAPGAPSPDARLAYEGDVESAAGVRSGVHLGLWLLEHAWGPDPAEAVSAMIEFDPEGDAAAG